MSEQQRETRFNRRRSRDHTRSSPATASTRVHQALANANAIKAGPGAEISRSSRPRPGSCEVSPVLYRREP